MNKKNYIGLAAAFLLILLLLNPSILPFSAETTEQMRKLKETHFLIKGSGSVTLAHILTLILAAAVIWLLYTVFKLVLKAIADKNEKHRTITELMIGAARYIAVIAGFMWGLSILGVDTTAILAGAGIFGLIIGFGAQSLIEDVITGLFIIFEHQYEIGDIIILDDFRGIVRSIGVRTTVIEDTGRNLKVVNNSDIRNFQNRSKNLSVALAEVSVSYDTDLRRLEDLIEQEIPNMYAANEELYLSLPRYLGVEELADSGVNLKFAVDVKEEDIFIAQRQLRRDIKLFLDQAGIEIPFPQVVVHNGK